MLGNAFLFILTLTEKSSLMTTEELVTTAKSSSIQPSVSHMMSIQTGINSLRNWFKRRFSADTVTLDGKTELR